MQVTLPIIVGLLISGGIVLKPQPTVNKERLPTIIHTPKVKHVKGRYPASSEDTIKVALIDSGVDLPTMAKYKVPICSSGHLNTITDRSTDLEDLLSHGTGMALAIHSRAQGAKYCIIVITIFSPFDAFTKNIDFPGRVVKALKHAKSVGANVVNMSFRGSGYDFKEKQALVELSQANVVMMAAAGNESHNLNKTCIAYPACYKGIKNLNVVGAKDFDELPAKYTNYGDVVDIWEYGTLEDAGAGTSFSCAFATGSIVKFWSDKLREKDKKPSK